MSSPRRMFAYLCTDYMFTQYIVTNSILIEMGKKIDWKLDIDQHY